VYRPEILEGAMRRHRDAFVLLMCLIVLLVAGAGMQIG
jgi:predicted nucleic acid-binding Zn ribbon protein